MLESLLYQHQETHFKKCAHCAHSVLQQIMGKHIQDEHSFHEAIGMLRSGYTDAEFNRFVAEKHIFSQGGHIFLKK